MDFCFTPEQEAFRVEVREFAGREWSGDGGEEGGDRAAVDRGRAFRRKLAERGWLSRAWPRDWGGLEASRLDQAIYGEEMALAGAAERYYQATVSLTIAAGTSEDQRTMTAARGLGPPRG